GDRRRAAVRGGDTVSEGPMQITVTAQDNATPALHDLFIALGGTEQEWQDAQDAPLFAQVAE
ncbi:MAG: hypothetical protein WC565_06440, partial [Parcubacteria group bacterium]